MPKWSDLDHVLVLRNRPLFGWINFEATRHSNSHFENYDKLEEWERVS
jgi:hypothetical protein